MKTKQPLKPVILIIENSIAITGALKSIARTSYDLHEDFHFLFVIPKKSNGRLYLEQLGFHDIVELDMKEISKNLSSLLRYGPSLLVNTFRLKRIIRDRNVSLIHVNDLYNMLPATLRLTGVTLPYICHVRFLPDRFPRLIFQFWLYTHLKFADKIIAVSKRLKEKLIDHPKIVYIPNELPIIEKYPSFVPNKNGLKRFLYLANVIPGKGQDHALEAFRMINTLLPGWELHFVGGDMGLEKNRAFLKTLQERVIRAGLTQKIHWRGFTNDVEVEYKLADIILNFSDSESFSLLCLEALYFGRPLITTNSGGPAEIVDHLETGLLVPVRDIAAMADAMVTLAGAPELRLSFSAEGRKRVRERFGVEKTSMVLRNVYLNSLS